MRRQCDEFDELIWDYARSGGEMPEEVRTHLDRCPSCKELLDEAKKVLGLLAAADCAEEAPDCRAAVMSRISGERRAFRLAWAYACVGVVIAGAVVGGMIAHRVPSKSPSIQAKRKIQQPAPKPLCLVEKNVQHKQQVTFLPSHSPRPSAKSLPRPVRRHHIQPIIARAASLPQPPHPELVEGPASQPPIPMPRAVAAVAVTYPVAGDEDSASYAYVERNAETGETTKCSVKRSGNTVEIYLESTPGGNPPPVKGSIQNEKTNNA